jgi:iron complex transport system permease protein
MRVRHARAWFATIVIGAIVVFIASLLLGPARISPEDLIRGVIDSTASNSGAARTLFWDLRLPRTALAAANGAALAVSGALLQAYFQNPMAGPYVIGVSSGAGLAVAIVAAVAGATGPSPASTPIASLAGGLAIVGLVAAASRRSRSGRTETILLLGLAISAICSSITSVLLLLLPRGPEGVLFWLMGSLASARWSGVALSSGGLLVAILFALWRARDLDAILWGDDVARSVGVDVGRVRGLALIMATVPAAASVASCGVIGFLGLMVPHLAREISGAEHQRLIPLSAILGATWLMIADLIARQILAPAELPVGAITSAVGAPFLAWMCLRRRW